MRSHKDYTIGWICALPLERAAAEAMLDEIHNDLPNPPADHNTYTLGRIHSHHIVIACLPSGIYGTTSATAAVSFLRSTFPNVAHGLMVGIGGGVPSNDNDIRLGDIVVGHPTGTVGGVVQYDLGKTMTGGDSQRTGMLNQPPQILLTAIARLRADKMIKNSNTISETVMTIFDEHPHMRVQFGKPDEADDRLFVPAYSHPDQENTCRGCDPQHLRQRSLRSSTEPQVYYGIIASGNQVIKDGQFRDRITKEINALCFEMEAAGIINHLPCLVIRGVCDYCDSHKNKAWQGYAALTAAAFSKELLSIVPVSLTGETDQGRECLQSLFLTDPVEDKNALKRKKGGRALGTCSWIFDTFELKNWLGDIEAPSDHSNILWLHGLPGTGKSTMAITLVEEIPNKTFFASGQNTLAYFFCDSSSEDRTTAIGILRGLLYELLRQRPELLRFVLSKYKERQEKLFATFDSLWSIFMDIANDSATGTKYIIINALDECDPESQKTILKQFKQSFQPSMSGYAGMHLRILVTSRPYPEIMEYLEQFNHQNLGSFNESKRDVDLFISERVSQLQATKRYTKKISDQVTKILKDKAENTFLWIGIACDDLNEIQSKDAIPYLQHLPSGLYSLYQRLLDKCLQTIADGDKIKRLLGVIIASRRPLSISELSAACDLYMDEEEEERLVFTRDEIHSCRLLVVIQDDKVQLLHKSTKDFLHRHFINELNAHAMLTYRCVDRLLQYSHSNNTDQIEDSAPNDAFLRYSVEFWPEHAQLAKAAFVIIPSQTEFFSLDSKIMKVWLNLYNLGRVESVSRVLPRDFSILHVAARWNILAVINHTMPMINQQGSLHGKYGAFQNNEYHDSAFVDQDGTTPLGEAAEYGHRAIFSALLERLTKNAFINERVIIALAMNRDSGKAIMKFLLDQRGDQIRITEEIVWAGVKDKSSSEIIVATLLYRGCMDKHINSKLVTLTVQLYPAEHVEQLLNGLGEYIPITAELMVAAASNTKHCKEVIELLLARQTDPKYITGTVVEQAAYDKRNALDVMTLLLDRRNNKLAITQKLAMIIATQQWETRNQLMLLLLNKRYNNILATPEVVELVVRFFNCEVMELLLNRLGSQIIITEKVINAAAQNRRCGDQLKILLASLAGQRRGQSSGSRTVGTLHDIPTLNTRLSSVTPIPNFYVYHVLQDHSDEVWISAFSHNGSRLATGSRDGTIIIYDAASFTVLCTLCGHDRVSDISWNMIDTQLISYGVNEIWMWDTLTGDLVFNCFQNHVTRVVFSLDCKTFVSSSLDPESPLCHWSESGKVLFSWPENFRATACSLTPDGTRLIDCSGLRTQNSCL